MGKPHWPMCAFLPTEIQRFESISSRLMQQIVAAAIGQTIRNSGGEPAL
jgi:hypothetical protein